MFVELRHWREWFEWFEWFDGSTSSASSRRLLTHMHITVVAKSGRDATRRWPHVDTEAGCLHMRMAGSVQRMLVMCHHGRMEMRRRTAWNGARAGARRRDGPLPLRQLAAERVAIIAKR